MDKAQRVAVAQFTHHGKEHLVLIRPYKKGLVLHTMYYADEVRSFDVDTGRQTARPGEITMAERLIDQLASDTFRPERYKDEYRTRLKAAVQKRLKGHEITAAEPEQPKRKVVDLMEALKQSLGGRARSARRAGSTRRAHGARRQGGQRRARA
jgi:DNA end-binding protein Ku